MMRRRDFLGVAAGLGLGLGSSLAPRARAAGRGAAEADRRTARGLSLLQDGRLRPPPGGILQVAFAIGPETQILDFTGPWEVFQGVHLETGDSRQHGEAQARHQEMDSSMPFRPYAVSDTTEPVEISGGLRVLPKYSFETAPQPEIVVVPAQDHHGRAPGIFDWLRRVSATADLILSVCNGSWLLAKAGLLSGRAATCHHASYDQMARRFPDVDVRRNVRFVEGPGIATAGGNSAGIDLALRVVERYFGREAAQRQADSMEYQGTGWLL